MTVNLFVGTDLGKIKAISTVNSTIQSLLTSDVKVNNQRGERIVNLTYNDNEHCLISASRKGEICQKYFEESENNSLEEKAFKLTSSHFPPEMNSETLHSKTGASIVDIGLSDSFYIVLFECGHFSLHDYEDGSRLLHKRAFDENVANGDNNLRKKLCVVTCNPKDKDIFAIGGKECDLQVWKTTLNHEKITDCILLFQGKNVRHNWLDLPVPIWIRDITFFPDSSKIVTCTSYGNIRMYDYSGQQRRPICDVKFSGGMDAEKNDEDPLISLCVVPHMRNHVIVGTGKGDMGLFDLGSCAASF